MGRVFRFESEARLRCDERSRPDPRHRGIDIVERSYVLVTGRGEDVHLPPGTGEAVMVSQGERPALVAEADGRYWWMYENRLYSAAEWLSRGTVAKLANGEGPGDDTPSLGGRVRGRTALSLGTPAGLIPLLSQLSPFFAV